MNHYDIAPQYPYKYFYIKYKIEHKDKEDQIIEFWTDDREEYLEKAKFISLHYNYHLIKQRYPRRRG